MATRKRWSRTVGTRGGNRVRIYEREAGANLQPPPVASPHVPEPALTKTRESDRAILHILEAIAALIFAGSLGVYLWARRSRGTE